jgi:hypothetical protein
MLERAVELDPTYAPAWGNLGRRYYLDAQYGGGGAAMFHKSNAALERALALDPNLALALWQHIANEAESGELVKAYQEAKNYVDRQPKNAGAHFVLGYVLRYAGLLDESARACEEAIALDSGNYVFRACAFTFSQMGDLEQAMEFNQLDAGSEWANRNRVRILLREGKLAEARDALQKLPSGTSTLSSWSFYWDLFEACIDHASSGQPPSSDFSRAVHEREPKLGANPDPENKYLVGSDMAFCRVNDVALRLLKASIEGKYCAYEALQKDPMLVPLRSSPEFSQMLAAAKQCQDNFLAERNQH